MRKSLKNNNLNNNWLINDMSKFENENISVLKQKEKENEYIAKFLKDPKTIKPKNGETKIDFGLKKKMILI